MMQCEFSFYPIFTVGQQSENPITQRTVVSITSTRWRLEARLSSTKANSPICARDIPTYKMSVSLVNKIQLSSKKVNSIQQRSHTSSEVLLLQPKALTTAEVTAVFTMTTSITDASRISTWFQRKWTWMSIPILARKRAAKKLRMGSTCTKINLNQMFPAENGRNVTSLVSALE